MRQNSLHCVALAAGVLIAAVTCGRDAASHRSASTSSAPDLVLRDTTPYESSVGGGTLAVLYVSGSYVDSVDTAFGVSRIGNDSLVFLPVRSFAIEDSIRGADITRHILATRAGRRELEGWLPHFSSYFSSPAVSGRAVCYWGLRPLSPQGGLYELYAMRYVFGTQRLDSLPLGRVELYTDNRFHLPAPVLTDSGFVFVGDSAAYLVSRDFRTVERRPPAARSAR